MSRQSLRNQGIPFALRHADQRMVTPREVERGLGCRCVCMKCGASLIARKGQERIWHFAHHGRGECPDGFESAVHWMAKQLILDRHEVWVPARAQQRRVSGMHGVWAETLSADVQSAGLVPLSDCVQEQTVSSNSQERGVRRPDVSAVFNGQPLAIEICNTHAVDEEKREWLLQRGLSTLEIKVPDLPAAGAEAIVEALERRLFSPSEFSAWLVHFGDAEALARLDDEERTLRAAKAGEEAVLLAERSRQLEKDRKKRQFRDDVRELECSQVPLTPLTTLRIARSKIRCTVKWYGYPPGSVVQAVRDLARRFSGRFNRDAMRWEYYRREGAEDLYAQILHWVGEHLALPTPSAVAFTDPNEQERFDERVAIMEFEGKLPRTTAEERAHEEMSRMGARASERGRSVASTAWT